MSWLYSQALVAEYLEGTCSDGAPFAPSSGNPTPRAYLPPDKMTAFSRPSRFGMTFAPLTDDRGEELLTWFRAGFPARTSAPPEKVLASTASEVGYGGKWRELSVRYDRDSCSWKTHRSLWDEDLSASSLTLPKWGSMRDGVLSELLTLERHTAAKESGLWPTPTASEASGGGKKEYAQMAIAGEARDSGAARSLKLRDMVKLWPTPTASEHTGPGHAAQGGMNLRTMVALFPTPTATNTKAHHMRGADNGKEREARSYGAIGQLNPTWVEWLMGWPLGWTDLKPLETDKFRSVRQPLGGR